MNTEKFLEKNTLIEILKCIFIAITFFIPDAALRFLTRWLGYYSIYELAPSLFSVCWCAVFIVVLSLFSQRLGRIIYAVWYTIWAIYSVCQYIYYLIFNKFFFLSDIANAGEGAAYMNFIYATINLHTVTMAILLLMLGILGSILFPNFRKIGNRTHRNVLRCCLSISAVISLFCTPFLFAQDRTDVAFYSPEHEYANFTNSGFDLEITGVYQYVARDLWLHHLAPDPDYDQLCQTVDGFISNKPDATVPNGLTGILKGKNVFLIQMESLDDWVINEKSAPTITRLMEEGINFTNMYTPLYGSGSTFSTEFAFNVGIFQSPNGIAAHACSRHSFPYSIANILSELGYTANSFHENVDTYYNRGSMHQALGYERYYSVLDYADSVLASQVDSEMIRIDALWDAMAPNQNFLSFIVSYSAHIDYNASDELAVYALERFPQYRELGLSEEMMYLYAKTRLTDEMFELILQRLEEDGLLEDTVIIAYTDHYCYGLSDKELVHQLTEANGTSILERTPAFIWYEGCESMEVDKICQTIDWVPTIANLFGVDVTPYVLGNDIFDPNYAGYAIFPDGTWLTESTYVVNGIPRWNNGMTETEIADMNTFVQSFYAANEAILASDYYSQFADCHLEN